MTGIVQKAISDAKDGRNYKLYQKIFQKKMKLLNEELRYSKVLLIGIK